MTAYSILAYEKASKVEGYEEQARQDFILSEDRKMHSIMKPALNYMDIYTLEDVDHVTGLLFEDKPPHFKKEDVRY